MASGKPVIGIAQSGSDLSPCNRHHIFLAERVREGIREAGGGPEYLQMNLGRALCEVARESDVPIVIHKANRTPAAAQVAQSHTAALANDDRAIGRDPESIAIKTPARKIAQYSPI